MSFSPIDHGSGQEVVRVLVDFSAEIDARNWERPIRGGDEGRLIKIKNNRFLNNFASDLYFLAFNTLLQRCDSEGYELTLAATSKTF